MKIRKLPDKTNQMSDRLGYSALDLVVSGDDGIRSVQSLPLYTTFAGKIQAAWR